MGGQGSGETGRDPGPGDAGEGGAQGHQHEDALKEEAERGGWGKPAQGDDNGGLDSGEQQDEVDQLGGGQERHGAQALPLRTGMGKRACGETMLSPGGAFRVTLSR